MGILQRDPDGRRRQGDPAGLARHPARARAARRWAWCTFNPHSLIAARLLSTNPEATVDALFLGRRLAQATALRDRLVGVPYYRLIHAEADGLPGVIIDRFGDALVVQVNTAGMELLTPVLLEALEAELSPKTIVLKNDLAGARARRAAARARRWSRAMPSSRSSWSRTTPSSWPTCRAGQKTGWFYDQRDNRRFMAGLAKDASVLDVYSYCGGFGVLAAARGAKSVVCIDRSQPALDAAKAAAALNGVDKVVSFEKSEVFDALEKLEAAGSFDVVICDPPAFVKSRKDLKTGAQGYRKLVRLAAPLVNKGGFFFVASCSHLVDPPLFAEQVRRGLRDAEPHRPHPAQLGRGARPSGASRPARDGVLSRR